MPLSNCPRCGKTFNRLPSSKICPDCHEVEEQQFERVYAYLRDNPGVHIPKIASDTEVPERLILEWFRTRRLLAKEPSVSWPCERCGAPVREGRLCQRCAGKFQASLGEHPEPGSGAPRNQPAADASGGHRPDIGHELRGDKYTR